MTRMRKSGRKPRRRKVIWLGTVQRRAFIGKRIALKESKWKGKSGESWGSGEEGQGFGEGAADFALKDFGHGGDRAGGFIEGDAFDAGHGEENGGEADALGVWFIE